MNANKMADKVLAALRSCFFSELFFFFFFLVPVPVLLPPLPEDLANCLGIIFALRGSLISLLTCGGLRFEPGEVALGPPGCNEHSWCRLVEVLPLGSEHTESPRLASGEVFLKYDLIPAEGYDDSWEAAAAAASSSIIRIVGGCKGPSGDGSCGSLIKIVYTESDE